VVGGWASNADSAPLKTMEIYDIASDTWTAGPNTLFFHGDTCVVAANDKVRQTFCASKLVLSASGSRAILMDKMAGANCKSPK
jgi:hypothetical protein